MKLINEISDAAWGGYVWANAKANAALQSDFDLAEAQKLSANPKYTVQPFVPVTDEAYAAARMEDVGLSYRDQAMKELKDQVMPALDQSKLEGLQKYLSADAATQDQIKKLLGVA
jgi:hypothetical protein